jgi:hypothetical protein
MIYLDVNIISGKKSPSSEIPWKPSTLSLSMNPEFMRRLPVILESLSCAGLCDYIAVIDLLGVISFPPHRSTPSAPPSSALAQGLEEADWKSICARALRRQLEKWCPLGGGSPGRLHGGRRCLRAGRKTAQHLAHSG